MGVPSTAEGRFYVACAALATTTLQQKAGAMGDELDWIWAGPVAGTLTLNDNGVAVFAWTTTAGVERFIPLNLKSKAGAWSITTTAGLTAFAAGAFK